MTTPLLGILFACSTHVNQLHVLGEPHKGMADMAVAEPIFWSDYVDGDPFRANSTVGNVTFSGGYITTNDGRGLNNVSRNVEITQEDRYREQVEQWLDEALLPTVVVDSPAALKTRDVRGTTSKDGHDNISLPRVTFRPVPVGPLDQPTVIPWVISYYTHNGGWFYGQQWGTAAGARVHVLLAAHDTDGSVLGWTNVDGARISERLFSPNGPELQDLLIVLEKRVSSKFD